MDFGQFSTYLIYFLILIIGLIIGRLTMAIQYAVMKPKPK